ncbi:MAG TPA: hypothetical protein PL045_10850, partial [Chitinophagaceae bacterium]|nr:hypothetical protein [Chitinophagaceae bacterium]
LKSAVHSGAASAVNFSESKFVLAAVIFFEMLHEQANKKETKAKRVLYIVFMLTKMEQMSM